MTEAAKQIRKAYTQKYRSSEEGRAAYNAYMREWRAKNRDKVKANNERYWEKKAAQLAAGAEP